MRIIDKIREAKKKDLNEREDYVSGGKALSLLV
jgi:hypothetical protein